MVDIYYHFTAPYTYGYWVETLGSWFTIIFAMLIRELIIWVGSKIRYYKLSHFMSFVTISCFYMYLFNYAIVPLLAPWDSRELPNFLFFTDFLFANGLYTDLNSAWFQEMAVVICYNMMYLAYWPIIEFSYTWALKVAFQCLDQCRLVPNNPYNTRSKTILGFEALYNGPEFYIHWKYATILTVVYVAALFGPMLPILFPISVLNLVILYFTERLMMAYSYKRPPMYDQTLNEVTINMLYTAPIIYCASCAWTFSN